MFIVNVLISEHFVFVGLPEAIFLILDMFCVLGVLGRFASNFLG